MAARLVIGNAFTRPQLFHQFRSGIHYPSMRNVRLSLCTASASSSSSAKPRKLILYSKPGCCLCDGLKEKLDAAFTLSSPNPLTDLQLEVLLAFAFSFYSQSIGMHTSKIGIGLNLLDEPKFPLAGSQIRDITTNPEWERLYQYEIPVLARVRDDGPEETLPRLSPRLGVELVQKKIAAAFD